MREGERGGEEKREREEWRMRERRREEEGDRGRGRERGKEVMVVAVFGGICNILYLPQALEEPKFSIAYANLCKVMSTIKVEMIPEEGKSKVVTFRRVLLTKCQQEFEKDKKDDDDREKMLNAIKETEDVSFIEYM